MKNSSYNTAMSFLSPAPHTRIKICGITRLKDAKVASELGVDALGFVFYGKSPRYIKPEEAAAIIRQLPGSVSAVGLFVNPTQQQIDETLKDCPLDIIQLHGDESVDFCRAQALPVMKAVAVSSADDLQDATSYDCAILLDARAPAGVFGGTGKSFNWSLLHSFTHDFPLILAGGLNPENIKQALAVRQWFAVDVSSGVETSPGLKDAGKMEAFVAAVRGCH
jgi:phosphoribosylanthranilate isomerase